MRSPISSILIHIVLVSKEIKYLCQINSRFGQVTWIWRGNWCQPKNFHLNLGEAICLHNVQIHLGEFYGTVQVIIGRNNINGELWAIVSKDKILKYHPRRYYIFSTAHIDKADEIKIQDEIELIARNHGCQVIVNGIIPTLKYYLRLIASVEKFVEDYSKLVEQDKELQAIHKIQWNNILKTLE
jgi:hypothetical protein